MYILESIHGNTLDSDTSKDDLIVRHKKQSSLPANVFFVAEGIKRFIERI